MSSGRGKIKAGMAVRIATAIGWPALSWGMRKWCWDASTRMEQQNLLMAAEAILTEMKKPSARMTKAAGAAMSPAKRPTPNRVGNKAKHAIRYQAMIEAAIAETMEALKADPLATGTPNQKNSTYNGM